MEERNFMIDMHLEALGATEEQIVSCYPKNHQKQYTKRNIMQLDRDGGYYSRHVSAMTGEGLHAKSDIAAELALRDFQIDKLRGVLKEVSGCYQAHGTPNLCDGCLLAIHKVLEG